MKHAGQEALDRLEPLLAELRKRDGLKEKSRGIFYRAGRAFLHFHEDPKGMFADIEDDRIQVDDAAGAAEVLARVAAVAART